MAVGGGNNPHTTEKQLVCEGAVFVSIYPVLVYFHYSLSSEAILLFLPLFFFFHRRLVSFLHLCCQRLGFYFCVVQGYGNLVP